MSADKTSPDKLSLVVFSGAFDKVHYALAMAAAAVSSNIPATLFFTMGGCRALLKAEADGTPGWHRLDGASGGTSPVATDVSNTAKGLAGFDELLEACALLGVKMMVCEMGLKAMDIPADAIRSDLALSPGGLVTFLADASKTGSVVFV